MDTLHLVTEEMQTALFGDAPASERLRHHSLTARSIDEGVNLKAERVRAFMRQLDLEQISQYAVSWPLGIPWQRTTKRQHILRSSDLKWMYNSSKKPWR